MWQGDALDMLETVYKTIQCFVKMETNDFPPKQSYKTSSTRFAE